LLITLSSTVPGFATLTNLFNKIPFPIAVNKSSPTLIGIREVKSLSWFRFSLMYCEKALSSASEYV